MSASKTIDFAARMAAKKPTPASENAPGEPTPKAGTIPIRRFNAQGIQRVAELLEEVRTTHDLHADDFEELLTDPEFSDEIKEPYRIDPTRLFPTKLDLCRYFTDEVFPDAFLESSATRADSGLWTWLAVAYYQQFVKRGKDMVKVASNARWIYEADDYRLSVRHYFAGPVYLYRTFKDTSKEAKEILFSSSPREFGGFVDAFTYKVEGTRLPVLMEVAAWLYYDGSRDTRIKKNVVENKTEKPGTVRQFLRVATQFAETRDFYGVEDAQKLWDILPSQFDGFKTK